MIKLSKETVCFVGGAIMGAAVVAQCWIIDRSLQDLKKEKQERDLNKRIDQVNQHLEDVLHLKQIYEVAIDNVEKVAKRIDAEGLKDNNKGLMS